MGVSLRGRIGIVGGSIAGCAAATAAVRAGCEVTVFERSTTLADRGLGIGMPVDTHKELAAAGYLNPEMPSGAVTERLWVLPDTAEPTGRVLWRQPISVTTVNWGQLWRAVADGVPEQAYRTGVAVTAVDRDGGVTTADGQRHEFDVVVGADGHQSLVRSVVTPDVRPRDAGYVIVRGVLPAAEAPAELTAMLESAMVTAMFDGGHAVFYLIPAGTGDWLLNWGVYIRPDRHAVPGEVERVLPAAWAEVCRRTESPTAYSVADMTAETYAVSPFVLVGDAASLARPHAASGAVKALQDGQCLQRVLESSACWEEALAAYDAQRRPVGNTLVDFGRRMGHAQVEHTPPWDSMTTRELVQWVTDSLAGHRHYLYQDG